MAKTTFKVAFLGPASSYTHQATRSIFVDQEDCELIPTTGIDEVFHAVESGHAKYGVVPFENSSFGVVKHTLDELADREGRYAGLNVCGETYIEIHHCLLGRQGRHEGLQHIRRVYSHQQALGQTKLFRQTHLAHVDATEAVSSTSRAAELVAADATGSSAAVASEMAAVHTGLDVLARGIEDRHDNTTWFIVLRRGTSEIPDFLGKGTRHKSLVSFTVPHAVPGALAGTLQVFARHALNLTNITRMPSLDRPFASLFFVEFEGSRLEDADGSVGRALQDLDAQTQQRRWWGSWVDRRPGY